MKHKKRFSLALAALMTLSGMALAETVSFEGTVVQGETHEVYLPIGGTVSRVTAEAGQRVKAGDVLAELKTTKVYATENGVVTGVFAQPGDSADTIAQKYGAVLYIEGDSVYTISASTDNAYDAIENKFVRVGEEVVLNCYSDGKHTGTGVITSIEGTSYTVEVKSGEFVIGESVNVFRGDTKTSNRIGRGSLTRKNPIAVTGSGSIVSLAVRDGDRVKRGDLLFETLDGSFDGLYMSGSAIRADVSGTVASVNLSQGGKAEKGGVAAVIYPEKSMRVKGQISESNLMYVAEGVPVEIELIWNQDEEVTYAGSVSMISAIASQSEEGEAVFDVYVDFQPDANTRYGMNAIVSTVEPSIEAIQDEAE